MSPAPASASIVATPSTTAAIVTAVSASVVAVPSGRRLDSHAFVLCRVVVGCLHDDGFARQSDLVGRLDVEDLYLELIAFLEHVADLSETVRGDLTDMQEAVGPLEPTAILMSHTAMGKDLAPRVAAALKTGLVSDATALHAEDGKLGATEPVYAGKAYVKCMPDSSPFMAT